MGSQDPGGGSSKFLSLAFKEGLGSVEVWAGCEWAKVLPVQPAHTLLPSGPRVQPGQLQPIAKLKAAGVLQRCFPGLSSPHPKRENREGRSAPHPAPATLCQGRENGSSWMRSKETMQRPILLSLTGESRGPLFRQHKLGRSSQSPPFCVHLQGEVCAVQKMTLVGDKEP